jgi:hypothetical protein
VFVVFRQIQPQLPGVGEFSDETAQFMKCLPGDISQPQREEIKGILTRYYVRSRMGEVTPEDRREVSQDMAGIIERGELSRKELEKFMAKVSYYAFRTDADYNRVDTTIVHPLLEEEQADSAR